MNRKRKRLFFIAIIGAVLMSAALLVLFALREEIVFFHSPSDIVADGKVKPGQRFRLGGLVKFGTVSKNGETVTFYITDTEHEVMVKYQGILPDLFRENQGVVAEGQIDTANLFSADTILAKHDENYMPREVADTLKEKGVWQGEDTQ